MSTYIDRVVNDNEYPYDMLVLADAEIAQLKAERDALLKDADRYRLLRRGQHWSVVDGIGDVLRGDELDAVIDKAMASSSKGGK